MYYDVTLYYDNREFDAWKTCASERELACMFHAAKAVNYLSSLVNVYVWKDASYVKPLGTSSVHVSL